MYIGSIVEKKVDKAETADTLVVPRDSLGQGRFPVIVLRVVTLVGVKYV
jgi:hypothetical protein